VHDKVKEISRSHVVHKGIDSFKNEKGIVQIEQIPGIGMCKAMTLLTILAETGWRIPKQTDEELNLVQQTLEEVLEKIKEHPSSWPFLEPVDAKEVFDYYEVIKDPMGTDCKGSVLTSLRFANNGKEA
jgi:histone acetyltransferase